MGVTAGVQELDIWRAAATGDASVISDYLAREPHLRAPSHIDGFAHAGVGSDRTALALAAQYGHTDIMTALLNAGADVDAFKPDVHGESGVTPLYAACSHAQGDAALLLLARGADPHVRVLRSSLFSSGYSPAEAVAVCVPPMERDEDERQYIEWTVKGAAERGPEAGAEFARRLLEIRQQQTAKDNHGSAQSKSGAAAERRLLSARQLARRKQLRLEERELLLQLELEEWELLDAAAAANGTSTATGNAADTADDSHGPEEHAAEPGGTQDTAQQAKSVYRSSPALRAARRRRQQRRNEAAAGAAAAAAGTGDPAQAGDDDTGSCQSGLDATHAASSSNGGVSYTIRARRVRRQRRAATAAAAAAAAAAGGDGGEGSSAAGAGGDAGDTNNATSSGVFTAAGIGAGIVESNAQHTATGSAASDSVSGALVHKCGFEWTPIAAVGKDIAGGSGSSSSAEAVDTDGVAAAAGTSPASDGALAATVTDAMCLSFGSAAIAATDASDISPDDRSAAAGGSRVQYGFTDRASSPNSTHTAPAADWSGKSISAEHCTSAATASSSSVVDAISSPAAARAGVEEPDDVIVLQPVAPAGTFFFLRHSAH
eukprot:TRINITY_DN20931_c0_g1_i1.p1 TRINITY_DN20931_c0_g1~~TRINITY_DN20931_c0_g1_i1.p1  ORF type:complete len:602 (-),score=192.91 TRINITY_DN20931_c0_g1_i1:601-2406(-)